jgi:chemotaxis protein methyltransferase CheR
MLELTENIIQEIINDVLEYHGYDFSGYAEASFVRRIKRLLTIDRFTSIAEFRYKLRHDKEFAERFIEEVTVNVTEMFRDPFFFQAIREKVFPSLATYPYIKIWHAGCSTGEEVYSMAILLEEANLLHKSMLYATDLNPTVIDKARKGIFPLSAMKHNSSNYIASGGQKEFSSYYTARYGHAIFDQKLSKHMVYATHNLVSDSSFNQFHLIVCRNVLIYFQKDLQAKVLDLFTNSLEHLGYLGLGSKETIKFSPSNNAYTLVDNKAKIWRKKK